MSREIKYDSVGGGAAVDPIAKFLDGSTERLRITQAGRLLINTTSDTRMLHVVGNTGYVGELKQTDLGANGLKLEILDTSNAQNILSLNSNALERLVITGAGRLGLNTSAPGALLDCRGDAIFNEDGADKDLRVEGDTDPNLLFIDASTDRIGVGTNAPTDKLTISGSVKVSGDGSFDGANVFNDSGADKDLRVEGDTEPNLLFIDASADRVAIGNVSPTARLHISKNDGVTNGHHLLAEFDRGTGANEAGILIGYRADGTTASGAFVKSDVGHILAIGSNGEEHILIALDGKVGIGTIPSEKLHVSGNLKIDDGNRLQLPKVSFAGPTPSGANGDMVYDSTNHAVKAYLNGSWVAL